jgi:hypothetical protein
MNTDESQITDDDDDDGEGEGPTGSVAGAPVSPKSATPSREGSILSILPVHGAPRTKKNLLKVKRGRGRPRKVERMPTTTDLEYHASMETKRLAFLDTDPLSVAIFDRKDSPHIIQQVKYEIARETASLHFQRIENSKYGRDTSMISSRRIDALERIAKIELKIKELDRDAINLSSEKMQKIFVLWVDMMRVVAQEVLPPETVDMFFNRFATVMEGWEEKAANTLR